jgi:ComF family protein
MHRIFSFLTSNLQFLPDLFFPNCCIACGDELIPGEKQVCLSCLLSIPETHYEVVPQDNPVMDLFIGKTWITGAIAIYEYQKGGALQALVHALKYNNQPELGVLLGRFMGAKLQQGNIPLSEIQVILPIPLHPIRQRRRGYNQAERLATGIQQVTGIPVRPKLLTRIRATKTQTAKGKEERWNNVRNIFKIQGNIPQPCLLVDDIITTGATLEACMECLNSAGIRDIWVISLGTARISRGMTEVPKN